MAVEPKLTHFDEEGRSRMVDVSAKAETVREATAGGTVFMKPETLELILNRQVSKGDVLGVARVAGIMAAKQTSNLIPMCHPLNITAVEIEFTPDKERSAIDIAATVRIAGKTGVEMEALTAVSVAALTIYDMCKAAEKGMVISDVRLLKKSGGKSGEYVRKEG
ncbi:MAG: cyclic pyranopterin monophosphate synthase MoaC [Nitrospirota bacterium]|nr:cyclic pyranopterin monophosphate synthase MoaC [Nitrospirota bacterium]